MQRKLWQELAQARWLDLPDPKSVPLEVQLRDATLLDQVPGRRTRRHAAHWALHPTPLVSPATAPPAVRLTALVLAAHTCAYDHLGVDMDILARLCGHSPQQTADMLDQLVSIRTLSTWRCNRESNEVFWQLPQPQAPTRPAALPCRNGTPQH